MRWLGRSTRPPPTDDAAAAVLATDGVFYDKNDITLAGEGLAYFGVVKFALGVALPLTEYPGGLKPWEIAAQTKYLTQWTDGNSAQLFNLGANGFNVLDTVATEIATMLPAMHKSQFDTTVLEDPYYCGGYSNQGRCQTTGSTNDICTWNKVTRRCLNKPRCHYPKPACGGSAFLGIQDKCCAWSAMGGVCVKSGSAPAYC